MSDISIPIEKPREEKLSCYISLDHDRISIHFSPTLPEGPHKPATVEIMAAGALLGIAKTLTGKGADEVLASMSKLDSQLKRRSRR